MTGEFPALYNDSEDFVSPNSLTTFRSDHLGGVQFVMLDGSVRMVSNETSAGCAYCIDDTKRRGCGVGVIDDLRTG